MSYLAHRAVGDEPGSRLDRDTLASMVATMLDERLAKPAATTTPPPPPPADDRSGWLVIGGIVLAIAVFGRRRR